VLLRNWTRANTSNTIYSFYAGEQADYLIHGAPHTQDGACSHRNEQVQLWSDFVAMAPPFLAYFGATLGGPNGTWLMQYAFDQCRLYRQYLRDEVGLWRHIVLGEWADNTHWATGNAWAASGMMRTLEAIKRSPTADQLVVQQQNLTTWVKEILDGAWSKQQANGTLLNVLDALPQTTFADASSTALIAAVTFRYAVLANDTRHVDSAVRAMELVTESVDGHGWLRGTVDPYTFNQPLTGSGSDRGSPEGQAFVLQVCMFKSVLVRKHLTEACS
jgi:rhamnogalacturonyl hydrolase YesR